MYVEWQVMIKFLDRIPYIICVDGSQPATKALEYAANLASKNESHLYIVHVIEEFGELIQRWEQHDSYVDEVKRLSKDLLHECEFRVLKITFRQCLYPYPGIIHHRHTTFHR